MRIISQDGSLDIPYDISAIELDTYFRDDKEKTVIYARTMDAYKSIATYSTEEKAIKAMEMCAENYAACEYNKIAFPNIIAGIATLSDKINKYIEDGVSEKYIFRFPKDEEVVV